MHAYNELYLNNAQRNLGFMLHYAVHDLKYDPDVFFDMFIKSGIAHAYGLGEPKYVVGMSGAELALETIYKLTNNFPDIEPAYSPNKTREYWAGWALAYYEWYSAKSFKSIISKVPVSDIISMYIPYHEMDVRQLCDEMDSLMTSKEDKQALARLRSYAGLSQKMLAEKSDVSVRMIEQYEQGKKDIKKASAETLYRLSKVLHCTIEDIIM